MKLFELGPEHQVALNKEWLFLIPEFAELVKRDKGSPGDYRGSKKLKATRELTFIYFDLDFSSPIREWPEDEKRTEALRMAGLGEGDIDGPLMDAHKMYHTLLMKSSRSLRTLYAVEKSLDKLDEYYERLNFSEKDKKGELVNKPESYLMNLKRLNEGYNALDEFRKRVEREMQGTSGIRGKANLGRREGKREAWVEKSAPKGTTGSYMDFTQLLDDEVEEDPILEDEVNEDVDAFDNDE